MMSLPSPADPETIQQPPIVAPLSRKGRAVPREAWPRGLVSRDCFGKMVLHRRAGLVIPPPPISTFAAGALGRNRADRLRGGRPRDDCDQFLAAPGGPQAGGRGAQPAGVA